MNDDKQFDFEKTIERFRAAIRFVNRRIINRTEVIDQIFCALLMREHALIQSRTGAAKSLLAQQIFAMFTDARTFMVQASKEQQPDTYFGGLDIEELKKGRIVHNTANSLVESEFGFIDEIFDANDYTLRALLTTLNERALVLGSQVVPARLHSVIAATNYLRVSEITEAVLDRFVFKALFIPTKTGYVQYRIAARYLATGARVAVPENPIPYATLHRVTRIVKGEDESHGIAIPHEVIYFANAVVRHYEVQRNRVLRDKPKEHPQQKDFYISPRTYTRAMDCLRVVAFLHGRNTAAIEDVARLWYLFTVVGMTEQREMFEKSYATVLHQLDAAGAFEQIRKMLEFQDFLDHLKHEPALLARPLSAIEGFPLRRTIVEWARETLGLSDGMVENNRRMLEGYVRSFAPLTEEIHELRQQQERDIHELFHPAAHIWR